MDLIAKVAILTLPLFFWPSPLKFELAKMIFFLGVGFFSTFWLLIKISKTPKKSQLKINKSWFLWIGILLISTLLNQGIFSILFTKSYRHQSVIFFFLLGLWGLIIKSLESKKVKKILPWAVGAVIIETLIICGQWLAIQIGLPIISYNQRPIGTFGEPNAVAGFLVLGLPILAICFKQTTTLLVAALSVAIAIILTGSKAGILALLAELTTYGLFWNRKFPFKKSLLTILLILFISIGIIGVWRERSESLFENRWLIWNLGIKALRTKPLLGYGAEGIIGVYEKQYRQINRPLENLVIDRSHNLFLDIALFSGLIGLVVFVDWLRKVSQKIIEAKHWTLIPLVGFLVFSFFQPLGVTHWVYFMLLVSLPPPAPVLKPGSKTVSGQEG